MLSYNEASNTIVYNYVHTDPFCPTSSYTPLYYPFNFAIAESSNYFYMVSTIGASQVSGSSANYV